MQIGIDKDADGALITLGGKIESYADAKQAAEAIFRLADLLWPEESAEHEAEIEAEDDGGALEGERPDTRDDVREQAPAPVKAFERAPVAVAPTAEPASKTFARQAPNGDANLSAAARAVLDLYRHGVTDASQIAERMTDSTINHFGVGAILGRLRKRGLIA